MAINKGTIAKEINGVVEYIYPKTSADIVEYSSTQSVKNKLDSLGTSIQTNITNITNLSTVIGDNTSGLVKDVNDLKNVIEDVNDLKNVIEDFESVIESEGSLMSSEDKDKLDGIEPGANNIIIDSQLDINSTNPVQNKVITEALNNNYYSKAEIDAIFAQIGWVGTLEDYNSLSIKNPRMIYTTIDVDGTIRRFMGDIELGIGLHLIGYAFVYLNGTSEDTNSINGGSTSYKDITANLKSLHTADENLTSKTTNTLCSNKGGLLIVFILHQSSIEITGDDWNFYQTSQSMGSDSTSYLSVYYKYIERDSPETITVSQSENKKLCVNAIIYEGYDNLELVESTSYPAKTDFDLNKVNDGMNIWALHTYEVDTASINFSIDDNTLAVYGNTRRSIFACVDESGNCANTIHITNSINNTNAQDVLCLHLLAIKEDE